MKFLKLTLTLLASFTVLMQIGCAFGNGSDEQNKAEIQDRHDLLQNFSMVTGTYQGVLRTNGKKIPLEVSIFSVDEPVGKNDKGETKFLPVLKLRYRQLDTVRPDLTLDARYIVEAGSLTAAEKANAGGTTIRGQLSDEVMTGAISNSSGVLGNFQLRRVDVNPQSPSVNSDIDYEQRLRTLYQSLAGTYEGNLTPVDPKAPVIPVRLNMYVLETVGAGNISVPYLRVDWVNPTQATPLAAMTASYQLELTPALLIISTQSGAGFPLATSGTLDQGVYTAQVSNNTGLLGTLVVVKK